MLDDQIGYIDVSEFDTVTYDQYKSALEEPGKSGDDRTGGRSS